MNILLSETANSCYLKVKNTQHLRFYIRISFSFLISSVLFTSIVSAQTGYIYVHTSTVDESSNPGSGGFQFTGTGGSSTISPFTLNDAPTYTPTLLNDIGAASTGTLFAATPGGVYYRQPNTATWNLGTGTTGGASKIDGCISDMAVYINSANNAVYLYNIATNTSTAIGSGWGSGLLDIAFDRLNSRVIVLLSNNTIKYATLTGTTVGSFSTVQGGITAIRLDADASGNLMIIGLAGYAYKIGSYTASSPTSTSLGSPATGGLTDIAAADDGSYFVVYDPSGGYISTAYKYNGTSGSFTSEPSAGYPGALTGGPAGQVWSTYNNADPGTVSIFTRQLSGTTPVWFDDERVHTSVNANSEMLAVAPGTYTITETPNTPNSSWNLQKITIYDPANASTSNVTNSTATITVTAGEVVHVVFQNYFAATTLFYNNCATSSFTENFGTGTAGSLGTISTGQMVGATSYHYYGTAVVYGGVFDGYYAITTNSSDVGQGTINLKDHTNPGTGNFLYVNASFQADVFYQREFTGLIPGNPYTVTYWLLNVTGSATVGGTTGINPINVTGQVTDPASGNVLASQTTGNITTVGVWTKETFTFTPGASQTAANFQLVNNGVGGNGNDIGLDDISFVLQPAPAITATVHNTCGSTSSSITITSPLGGVYQYSIDGVNYQTSPIFSNLSQGTKYTVYANYIGSTGCASVGTATTPNTTYTWTGTTSTDPTIATNWSGGVAPPLDGSASLNIPVVSSGKYPVLTASESVFSLTIAAPGATTPNINLGAYTLNVGCNIINGGILNSGTDLTNSTINWNGDSANQSYTGNSTAGTAKLGNMTVNNTYTGGAGVVTISSGPVDIYNALNMTEGNLTIGTAANTLFTLKSLQNQTATVSAIASPGTGLAVPVITGSVNVERFITGGAGYRGYRLLSSPVNISSSTVGGGNLSLAYINQTVGSNHGALTGGPGAGYSVSNPNPTIYLYNEALTSNVVRNYTAGKNIGIYAITGNTVTTLSTTGVQTAGRSIPVGNGYIFYFIGDNSSTITASSRTIQNTTITATGTLNQGSVPVTIFSNNSTSLSYTPGTATTTPGGAMVSGLNQVGNPYASTISLDQLWADNNPAGTTTGGISSFFYELQEPGQAYITYDASSSHRSSSSNAGPYIVSGQGFITAAQAAGQTITFKEDQKVNTQITSSTTPKLLLALKTKNLALAPTPANAPAGLHLQLSKDSLTNTQTGIYFSSAWSDNYTSDDAADLGGFAALGLSSLSSDGAQLSINSMGDYIMGKRVKLFVKANTTAQYNLKMADIRNIDAIYNVMLVDNLLKDSVNLRTTAYNFTITTTDTTTFGANRFVLAVELKALPPYKLLTFTGKKANAGIQLAWTTSNEGYYTGFVLQKQTGTKFIAIDSLQGNSSGNYSYLDANAALGLNTYRLKQIDAAGGITYSALVNVNTSTNGAIISVYPNPARQNLNMNINLAPTGYNLSIYNSFGAIVKQVTLSGNNWEENVGSYNAGTYIIMVNDKKGNFIGKTKFVKVE